MSQAYGRSDGIFPRTKKQSTGLFFARCGAPSCSNPRPSGDKKDPQPKLEVLLVGVTGFEPTASWSRTKRATTCATPRKEKPQQPGCCGVVGDERIELPRAESESAALPLCESPSGLCLGRLPSTLIYYSVWETVCQQLFQTFLQKSVKIRKSAQLRLTFLPRLRAPTALAGGKDARVHLGHGHRQRPHRRAEHERDDGHVPYPLFHLVGGVVLITAGDA